MSTGRYELQAMTYEDNFSFDRGANELIAQGWELETAQAVPWNDGDGRGTEWHCIFRRWYPTGVPRHDEEPHKQRERERGERIDDGPGITAVRAHLRGSAARDRMEKGKEG